MDVYRVKRLSQTFGYGVHSISKDFSGNSSDSFKQQLGNQLKEQYRSRVSALFDEISEQAVSILDHIDLSRFEKYRELVRELLHEVVRNAYTLNNESVFDHFGKQRIYSTISKVDEKLEALASDVINRNSDRIDYISRIDEIRGLVMDTFF